MAQKTWNGSYTDDWTIAADWGGTLPGSRDDVLIPSGTPTITTDVGAVRSLTVNGGLDITGSGSPAAITTGRLVSPGFLQISGDAAAATLNVQAAAGTGVTGHLGGTIFLDGNATLAFASGQISTIDGQVLIQGPDAHIAVASDTKSNSALRGLSTISNTGWFNLEDGAAVATTGSLTNNGELDADAFPRPNGGGSTGGSTLKVGGTLVQNGRAYLGAYQLYKPVSITAAVFNNTGYAYVNTGKDASNTPSVVAAAATSRPPFLTGVTTTLSIAGATTNSGLLWLASQSQLNTASYTQTASGKTVFGLAGSSQFPGGAIKASGPVTLKGGAIQVDAPPVGTSQVLVTFAPGTLTGMVDHLALRSVFTTLTGSGTTVRAANGTLVGLVYDNALGTISLAAAAPVSTTLDTFKGGSLTDPTRWSAGLPSFYSDVVIAPNVAPAILDRDATINSLSIGAGDAVSTRANTDLSVGATASVGTGATLTLGGQMTVVSSFTNNGQVAVNGTADIRGNTTGTGGYTIGDGGLLEFGAASSSRVDFSGKAAQLKLDTPYLFTGTLANLGIGDSIDLVGVKNISVTSLAGTSLTVHKDDGSSQTFKVDGLQGRAAYGVQDDGAGGSRIVVLPYGRPSAPGATPTFSGALAASTATGSHAPSAFATSQPSVAASAADPLGLLDRHSILV